MIFIENWKVIGNDAYLLETCVSKRLKGTKRYQSGHNVCVKRFQIQMRKEVQSVRTTEAAAQYKL